MNNKFTLKEGERTTYAVSHPYAPVTHLVFYLFVDGKITGHYFHSISEGVSYIEGLNNGYIEYIHKPYPPIDYESQRKYEDAIERSMYKKSWIEKIFRQ